MALPEAGALEVELGCGDGLFLVARALRRPETFFCGIDIRDTFLAPGRETIAELGLPNVLLETANLHVDLHELFPAQRVDRFFVNFPDPFFKRKQQQRRWLDAAALTVLLDALRPGGEFIYQTDVWDCAVEALGLLELAPSLENNCGAFTFSRDKLVDEQTSREKSCLERGLKIWRLAYRKLG